MFSEGRWHSLPPPERWLKETLASKRRQLAIHCADHAEEQGEERGSRLTSSAPVTGASMMDGEDSVDALMVAWWHMSIAVFRMENRTCYLSTAAVRLDDRIWVFSIAVLDWEIEYRTSPLLLLK